MRPVALVAAVWILTACQQIDPSPTRAEVFHMRSECLQLGEKLVATNKVEPLKPGRTMHVHYSIRDNRCYVRIISVPEDVNLTQTSPNYFFMDELYDGQTQEEIAFSDWRKTFKTGLVMEQSSVGNFEVADAYIRSKMAEEPQGRSRWPWVRWLLHQPQ